MIEQSILTGGAKGKESMIRSSVLINLIHDAVKYELQQQGVAASNIYPHFRETKPEIKLAGFLKQKDQDVCVIPSGITKTPLTINWGLWHSKTREIRMARSILQTLWLSMSVAK